MLHTVAIAGYRSLRDIVLPLGALTVVTGANGSGKSNLYRGLRLLSHAARGGLVAAVAHEGGIPSLVWAGPEAPTGDAVVEGTMRSGPVAVRLGFATDDVGYLADLGIPQTDQRSAFARDPEIKREQVFAGAFAKPSTLLVDRTRSAVRVRDGEWVAVAQPLAPWESVVTDLAIGDTAPELLSLRRVLQGWRFYDHFRVDSDAPARHPQVATRTQTLSHDGADLAAVWQTIVESGRQDALDTAVARAFPGARVRVTADDRRLRLVMHQAGLLRPLEAAELSDGTLRYLLLCAAVLPARPGPLIVLNEPEASLHPDLLVPLAELIRAASRDSQVVIVTHAAPLARALEAAGALVHTLESTPSGTRVADQGTLDRPPWHWPTR
jgi:predicted ATPase